MASRAGLPWRISRFQERNFPDFTKKDKQMTALLKCIVLAVLAVSFWSTVQPANAEGTPLTFCNRLPVYMNIAIGYHTAGPNDPPDHSVLTGPFVSDGWYRIEAGQCVNLPNPHSARYIAWFGLVSRMWPDNNNVWHDSYNVGAARPTIQDELSPLPHMCVSTFAPIHYPVATKFTYEVENVSISNCKANVAGRDQNLWVKVKVVDLTIHSTVDFTGDSPDYTNQPTL